MRSYIPAPDGDFDTWLSNFATKIAAHPTDYGLIAGDATAMTAAQAAWATAYALVLDPATRTKVTIADKVAKRTLAQDMARGLAQRVQMFSDITPLLLSDLNLTVPDTTKTPVATPTSAPTLSVPFMVPGGATLRFQDPGTPTAKAKPDGVWCMNLYQTVSPLSGPAPTDPTAATFVGTFTKTPSDLIFNSADNGKRVTLWGRWATRTGKMGPFSSPVSLTISF